MSYSSAKGSQAKKVLFQSSTEYDQLNDENPIEINNDIVNHQSRNHVFQKLTDIASGNSWNPKIQTLPREGGIQKDNNS